MIYRNDPYLDAQFQKAVQAAHNQDWDTFEHSSFYDARMMEDLLYVCEDFMPLEAKCRFALEHYDNHGDHSPIIRKYVRRARIIRPENWRDALPESVRDLLYQLPVHVYQATIKADKIIAYLNYRNEFEVLQYRNIKDVQEITPLRGYSSLYNAFLKSQSTPGSDSDAGDRYFNEWYQAQGK